MSDYGVTFVFLNSDHRYPKDLSLTVHHVSCGKYQGSAHKQEIDKTDINKEWVEFEDATVRQRKCGSCHAKPPAPNSERDNRWRSNEATRTLH